MSLESIIARTAARKAAGANQTYPLHAQTPATEVKRALPVLGPPCPDLGDRTSGGCCGSPLLHCTRFGDITTRFVRCQDAQRCCVDCNHNPVNKSAEEPSTTGFVIDQGAGGIGDGLLGLTAVAQLSSDHPGEQVEYRVSDTARPFVELFDSGATYGKHLRAHSEKPVRGARQMNQGYTTENQHKYPVPRWERYAKNIGASGVSLPKLREPEKVKAAGADLAGCVVLCPFSTDRTREWSVHHWLTLEGLLHRAGYRTVALHSEAKGLAGFKGQKLAGASAERVAGVMLNAVCTIGTDSGLAHLAGILGTPTVVLGGSTPVEKIFGVYPRVKCIQGRLSCSGCCGGTGVAVGGMDDRCRASCANLQSITPQDVLAAVDRVWLKETLTCDAAGNSKSLLSTDRLAVLRDLALATNGLPGDVAELGCYLGGSAKLLRHYATGTLHLFDTFAGIPEPDTAEGGIHGPGEFIGSVAEVQSLVGTKRVEYHVGTFPTGREPDVQFRFVHLDLDTLQSTRAALECLWSRLVHGGVIVLDDLDWQNCPGVRRALQEVLPGVSVESPARYQGVIRKPA